MFLVFQMYAWKNGTPIDSFMCSSVCPSVTENYLRNYWLIDSVEHISISVAQTRKYILKKGARLGDKYGMLFFNATAYLCYLYGRSNSIKARSRNHVDNHTKNGNNSNIKNLPIIWERNWNVWSRPALSAEIMSQIKNSYIYVG